MKKRFDKEDDLRKEIKRGVDSGEPTPLDIDTIKERGRKRLVEPREEVSDSRENESERWDEYLKTSESYPNAVVMKWIDSWVTGEGSHSIGEIKSALSAGLQNSLRTKERYERALVNLPEGKQRGLYTRLLKRVEAQIDYLNRLLEVE
jgi:hypothetical protein